MTWTVQHVANSMHALRKQQFVSRAGHAPCRLVPMCAELPSYSGCCHWVCCLRCFLYTRVVLRLSSLAAAAVAIVHVVRQHQHKDEQ